VAGKYQIEKFYLTYMNIEDIPDPDRLYYRIHRSYYPEGKLNLSVFRDIQGGMSVDWEKYSTPTETRSRANNPEANGVISMVAVDVRSIPQQVEHRPSKSNVSHSEIIGQKSPEVRLKLSRVYRWEIVI